MDAIETGIGAAALPQRFADWFTHKGWAPHPHQLAMIEAAQRGAHTLLMAPTGGGKTLAGFLPSMIDLAERPHAGLHTLYISPLKALAVDIQRNVDKPIAEMRLPIRAESRTGDTPQVKRTRQRKNPPAMLMTTPESLALMLSYGDSPDFFGSLKTIIIDEIHAFAETKRGHLLALGLARLASLAPQARRVGLSATAAMPDRLRLFLSPDQDAGSVETVIGPEAVEPQIEILVTEERLPWAGHMAMHAIAEVYERIKNAETSIVFVNTRAQAELVFQELWRLNEDGLAIGLHHGSLAREQRRKVEAAMAAGKLRAVVATSSLDLGIDWGEVDLVVQIGAPKGASRLIQRIGRANHRMDCPSRALLVPANRFEFMECRAALDAVMAGELDGDAPRPGALDVLAQHLTGMACARPFDADAQYEETQRAGPYAALSRADFDDVLNFAATGGYALAGYDRFRRLKQDEDGLWTIAAPVVSRQYRMNVGTIVEAQTYKVRLNRGPMLGEVEDYFVNMLTPGDTFLFAGRLLRFEGIRENTVMAGKGGEGEPKVPAYVGGKLPLSTNLADRVRAMLADRASWAGMPPAVRQWLGFQDWRSVMPPPDGLLVETFPRGPRHFLVAYCFEGRNAHQTLGMLLTRRMERMGMRPLGFVATDYVIAVWSLRPAHSIEALFDQDMLGDDLEEWMAESSLLRRTFRNVAVVSGLIQRKNPGQEKSGRQLTINTDLIYDVLREHEPNHILLRATRADAAGGLTDVRRLADMLVRVQGKIEHRDLDRISPLAVPVMLEVGREQVYGSAIDDLLDETAEELIAEATGSDGKQAGLPL